MELLHSTYLRKASLPQISAEGVPYCSKLKYDRAKSNFSVFLFPLFLEDSNTLPLHWQPWAALVAMPASPTARLLDCCLST